MTDLEPNQTKTDQPEIKQLFSSIQIGLGCFFGTPFTSLKMLAQNYKVSGLKHKYITTTLLAYVFLIPLFFFITELLNSNYYRILIFVVAGGMTILSKLLQKEIYQTHKETGGMFQSGWKVFLTIAWNVLILFGFLCIYLMITDADF